MNATPISCIILAGGRGKRFDNKDKGLIQLNGKPLIEHVIGCIAPQVDDIVISANRNIDDYKKYTDTVIADTDDDFQGPLTGISSCLPTCKHEWILVLPCDTPFLPSNLAERLNAITTTKLIVAKARERRQLVFLMHKSLNENLEKYLQQGHKKVMTWIELQKPAIVEFENDASDFLNINTQETLNSL